MTKYAPMEEPDLVKARTKAAYELMTQLVTARDDSDLTKQLVQSAIDDFQNGTVDSLVTCIRLLGQSVQMMADYMRVVAITFDSETSDPGRFDRYHRATVRRMAGAIAKSFEED